MTQRKYSKAICGLFAEYFPDISIVREILNINTGEVSFIGTIILCWVALGNFTTKLEWGDEKKTRSEKRQDFKQWSLSPLSSPNTHTHNCTVGKHRTRSC